jgi:hypothetical protein
MTKEVMGTSGMGLGSIYLTCRVTHLKTREHRLSVLRTTSSMHDHDLATHLLVRQVVLHSNGYIYFVPKTGLILPTMSIHMPRIGTLQSDSKRARRLKTIRKPTLRGSMHTGTLGSDMRNVDPAVRFARVSSRYLPRSAMSIRSCQRQPSQQPGPRFGNSSRQMLFMHRSMVLETTSNMLSGCVEAVEAWQCTSTNQEQSYRQDAGCLPLASHLNRVCGEHLDLIGLDTQTSWLSEATSTESGRRPWITDKVANDRHMFI